MYNNNDNFENRFENNKVEDNNTFRENSVINQQDYTYRPLAENRAKKSSGKGKVVALALAFSLFGGALGTGGTLAAYKYFNKDKSSSQSVNGSSADKTSDSGEKTASVIKTADSRSGSATLTETKVQAGDKMTASEVYKNNVDSTVGITTEISTNYFGYQSTAAASGSGFIITEDGYIVTNHHVIDGANKITVTTYDGTTYDAELIGSDEQSDIAVLKIDATGLKAVTLGTSEELEVGEDVVAIGNPLGELTFTLTRGVVSALDRDVTTGNSTMMNLIQTDCAINSGNSGGALFNMYGEVVGVTNAKYSSNSSMEASIDNIGFAIPIDDVKTLIKGIIENGYVSKPYIGVGADDVSSDLKAYGLPEGALIRKVYDDSPAKEAGIQENDIVIKANGEDITCSSDLVGVIRKCNIGDELDLTIYRKNEEKQITVKIAENKEDTSAENEDEDQPQQQFDNNGRGSYGYGEMDPFEFFERYGY